MIKVLVTTSDFSGNATCEIGNKSIITWFVANQLSSSFCACSKWESSNNLSDKDKSIILEPHENFHSMDIATIIRIENISNESCLFLEDGNFLKTKIPINNFDDLFKPFNFFQIHPNHLINIKHLKSLVYCNAYVTLSNSDAIPVSSGNDKQISEYLNSKPLL